MTTINIGADAPLKAGISLIIGLIALNLTPLHAETRYGYHLHNSPVGGFKQFTQFQQQLKYAGGKSGRIDTYWPGFQTEPKIAFNPNASKLPPAQYQKYLFERGYGENGGNLYSAYSDLHDSLVLGLTPIFNFGIVPEWAYQPASRFTTWKSGINHEFTYHPTPEQIKTLRENSIANPNIVGEFLSDLTVYISKQPSGMETLRNLGGWEIFNEVGAMYGNGTPPSEGSNNPADAWTQLPYTDYLAIIDSALSRVHSTYKTIDLKNGPPVITPPIGGSYHLSLWQAIADYHPKNATSKNANGHLALDQIGLHPYGQTVQAWLDPDTLYHLSTGSGATDVQTNMSYGRVLMPTDDAFTWSSLVERAKYSSFSDRLYLYASRNSIADRYWDGNAEMGMARTMARFAQMGYGKINVNISEFGASSYIGFPSSTPNFTQINTSFADPFKYGEVHSDLTLNKDMAENLQSEAITQALGLMRNWDFVNTATIYEMFERPLPTLTDADFYQYGLSAPELKPDGTPNWKPAGQIYNAFLRGQEIHQLHEQGVDIHISAANGTFDDAQIKPDAHNVILFNDTKPHSITTGTGDDIIFGGYGDDFIAGGNGHNRLYGGFGNDIIVGRTDNDKINGGSGDDLLTGGGGKNEFMFSAYSESGSGFDGADTITDFKSTDVLTIIGGYSFEKMRLQNEVEGGVKGVKITYATNGASIFLQGLTAGQLSKVNFVILEPKT